MLKKITSIIEIIFIILVSIFCLMSVCQKFFFKDNSFFGFRTFSIVSESMKPQLEIGDIILVKETKYDKIKIGDILTYQGMTGEFKDKVVTHRVKNILEENGKRIFYTKGINSSSTDPAVYEEQVYGTVTYKFKVLSLINKAIQNIVGFIILVIVPLIYLLTMEIITVIKESKVEYVEVLDVETSKKSNKINKLFKKKK